MCFFTGEPRLADHLSATEEVNARKDMCHQAEVHAFFVRTFCGYFRINVEITFDVAQPFLLHCE